MVTQWFHVYFPAFSNHEFVVIPTSFFGPNSLEFVHAFINAIFFAQLAFERIVLYVWRSEGAHDFSITLDVLPRVSAVASRAETVLMAAMLRGVCAKRVWK
jgi:hypothetical protein